MADERRDPQLRAGSTPIRALALGLGALLLLGACRPPRRAPLRRAPALAKQADTDPLFPCTSFIHARAATLLSRLDPAPIAGFARLSPAGGKVLRAQLRRSTLRYEVQVAAGRMLLVVPAGHPGGPLELVLAEDRDQLVVFLPGSKQRVVLPRSRLPDVLELGPASERAGFKLKTSSGEAREPLRLIAPAQRRALRQEQVPLAVTFRRRVAATERGARRYRAELTVTRAEAPGPGAWPEPLYQVALPWLQQAERWPLAETLTLLGGTPAHFSVALQRSGRTPGPLPALHSEVVGQGLLRVPLCRLSAVRQGYSDARYLPPPPVPGAQQVPASALTGLRDAAASGALTVINKARLAAQVFVDGFRLGWVGPGRQMRFEGLPDGFYRVYARSPLGTLDWGPFDLYVPGPLTLRP